MAEVFSLSSICLYIYIYIYVQLIAFFNTFEYYVVMAQEWDTKETKEGRNVGVFVKDLVFFKHRFWQLPRIGRMQLQRLTS